MTRKWKYWLAAASVLLMVGAGCTGEVQQGASVQTGAQTGEENGTPAPAGQEGANLNVQANAGVDADVDTTVDSALKEADDETSASLEEGADANVVGNDSAELNAYGQAYDQSQL